MNSRKLITPAVAATAVLAAGALVGGCQTTSGDRAEKAADCYAETPLPTPVEVTAPADDVPETYARFVGVWSNGKWDGKLCHTLVVTSVTADGRAEVIYSHGAHAPWGIDSPDFYADWPGRIADGTLKLAESEHSAKVSYTFVDGELTGTYVSSGTSKVTLEKVAPPDA